jgi:hypothetical protein
LVDGVGGKQTAPCTRHRRNADKFQPIDQIRCEKSPGELDAAVHAHVATRGLLQLVDVAGQRHIRDHSPYVTVTERGDGALS